MKDKKDKKARFNKNDEALLRVLRELSKEYADKKGEFSKSNSELRELTGIPTDKQFLRSIKKLVGLGIIERKPSEKRGESTVYRFHEEAYGSVSEIVSETATEIVSGNENVSGTGNVSDAEKQGVTGKKVRKGTDKNENVTSGNVTSENVTSEIVSESGLFDSESKGDITGNEPNSLKMRGVKRFDGENDPNSLIISGGSRPEADGEYSEKCTTDIDLEYNIYHDDHVSRGQDPGEETSYEEEKNKKTEKRKKEEIEDVNRELDVCKAEMDAAAAAGDKSRYKKAFDKSIKLRVQLAELGPEDKYAKMTDAEIVKMVEEWEGPLLNLPQTVRNRYQQMRLPRE